jgi:hypothetical protein
MLAPARNELRTTGRATTHCEPKGHAMKALSKLRAALALASVPVLMIVTLQSAPAQTPTTLYTFSSLQ